MAARDRRRVPRRCGCRTRRAAIARLPFAGRVEFSDRRRARGGRRASAPSTRCSTATRSGRPTTRLLDWVEKHLARDPRPEEAGGRGAVPPHRHHLRGLRRGRRHRAADPLRHDAAGLHRGRVAPARARGQAAGAGAERLPLRRLPSRRDRPRRGHPGRPRLPQRGLRAGRGRHRPAGRGLFATSSASTSCAPAPTTSSCSRTTAAPRPGVCYMLENREIMMRMFPELFRATRIEPVDDYPDRLRRTLASVAPAEDRGRAGQRHPVAGLVQQRLLRALVPRRPDGHRAGRGAGSLRAGRLRLHAHHRGAAAGRRDLPPDRRHLPRPALLPPRLDARRARADERLPLGRRRDLLGAGRGGRRRQGGLHLRAGDDPLLPRREARS